MHLPVFNCCSEKKNNNFKTEKKTESDQIHEFLNVLYSKLNGLCEGNSPSCKANRK